MGNLEFTPWLKVNLSIGSRKSFWFMIGYFHQRWEIEYYASGASMLAEEFFQTVEDIEEKKCFGHIWLIGTNFLGESSHMNNLISTHWALSF